MSELSFIQDIPNQVRIIDIDDVGLFNKTLAKTMTLLSHLAGIKDPVSDANKIDLREMILMRYKELSFDEVYYAFKLERYGVLGDKINHFQLFDASYVSKILERYKKWKMDKRKQYNIQKNKEKSENVFSESKKERAMLDAVDRAKKEIEKEGKFLYSRHHIYDWLIETGRMKQPSVKERKAAHSISKRKYIERLELEGMKDRDSRKKAKYQIANLSDKNTIIINRAKSMLLEEIYKAKS